MRLLSLLRRTATPLACLAVWACALPSGAQSLQTAVVGQVRDATGGVMPGVTVTVTNTATGVTRLAVTDGEGAYSVTALVTGSYTVLAELEGFKSVLRQGVVVQADTATRVDVVLEIGDIGETVEVVADASSRILRTEDASMGVVLSDAQIEALPIRNRNFMALAQIVPGATESLTGNQNTLGRAQPLNLSVHGQRHFDNNIRLDGVSLIAAFVNSSTFIPSLEAIKEVSVQTGQYSAAYGMYSGAQVDMIVKSGSNAFRGSGYGYYRGDELNARRYFDQGAPPPFTYRQYGANLGGPIFKNRTFFFFNYEGAQTRREVTGQATAAPEAFRRGDFSALLPGRVIRDPFTGQPFPGNIIPAGRIAPQAVALMAFLPLPNRPGLAANFVNTGQTKEDDAQYFVRLDHEWGSSTSMFFRAALRNATIDNVQVNPNFQSFGRPSNQSYVLGLTHTLSPRWLVDARLAYVRESSPNETGRQGTDIDPLRDFGIAGLNFDNPLVRGVPSANISGYMGTGETFANPRLLYTNPRAQVNSAIELGRHSVRFGVEVFRRGQDFYSVNASNQGAFTFNGLLSGDAFADFVLGLPDRTDRLAFLAQTELRQRHVHAYVQDDWRPTPNLTVNAGLRYEYAGAYRDQLGATRNFDWTTLSLFPEPDQVGDLNEPSHDLAPRVSVTYRWADDTVVRGGYGFYYTQPTTANVALMFRNPPRNRQDTFNTNRTNPTLTLANGFPDGGAAGTTAPVTLTTIPLDYGPGYAQTWSLNAQRRLAAGWVGEVGYVGSQTTGLDNAYTRNTPPPGPGAVQARRPLPQFGDIRVFATDGEASYHGLQLRGQHTDFYGMNVLASYAWSKCFDTRSSPATSTVGTEDQEPQDQANRFDGEWGRCAIDFRHVFKLSASYRLPFGDRLSGLPAALLRDWQLGVGVNLRSGGPFNVIMSGNPANTSRGTIRPNRVSDGNLPSSDRTIERWFDTSAFAAPPPFTYGNAGRNVIEGPGAKLVDVNLVKRVRLGARQAVEVRADVFNALNTPQFGTPGRVFGTAQFGRITSTGPAREIQLGLKYTF
jgi:hypothetical protein